MKRRTSLDLSPDLNITNIIDVIFAILVVFMITAPLMSQGIKVDLPKAQAASLDEKKSINITITKEREIVIDELPSDQRSFRSDFRRVWTGNPETVVVINADTKVPYGFVMQLVAETQKEGAKRLGFLTDPSIKLDRKR
ncbi:MAG: biopolymer transporter ExbD [Fibrobacteria bacterium]|nr:biopolymer transporter ExbD [Fibrobacteria bacterium]